MKHGEGENAYGVPVFDGISGYSLSRLLNIAASYGLRSSMD